MKHAKKHTFVQMIKKINWKDKHTYLAIFLIAILCLVIALPTGGKGSQKELDQMQEGQKTQDSSEAVDETAVEDLEGRLEEILEKIDGAGEVKVMITLADTGEQMVEKDEEVREDTRTQTTVFLKEGNLQTPFVSKVCTPKVEGVLVVAQGGADSIVKQEILNSVQSLFGIETHKITVAKMSYKEGETS